MKSITIVIPSYWGSEDASLDAAEVIMFDHPTPLNQEGTLARLLDSLELIGGEEFRVVILAVANTPHLVRDVVAKIHEIVEPYRSLCDIAVLHRQTLNDLREAFIGEGVSEAACELINLGSYPSVRNMCSLAGILSGSTATIFLDDDEVVADKMFLDKAREFIGTEYQHQTVQAVAGYYLQRESFRLDVDKVPEWRKPYWNNAASMNEAFEIVIGRPPRLKATPFVFGGNMVIHRDTLMEIPFDPLITRGEDIDFLINLRINGLTFWLDRELSVRHLPPKASVPAWRSLREDMRRLLYERKKVMDHERIEGVSQDQLMPYPGTFLGEDLEERMIKTNELLREEYRKLQDKRGMDECEVNIHLARRNAYKSIDTRRHLRDLTTRWQELTRAAAGRGIPE